jgi:MoaA/NifB/PqqE/SkfB family radical SAM enzyme
VKALVERRALVSLTHDCTNACVMCGVAGLGPPLPDVRGQLDALRAEGTVEVSFGGGEPGLVPGLGELVAYARGAGFARVGVQTNGLALRSTAAARALAAAGLTDAHLSLHGALPAAHDYHTARAGSHAEVLVAIDAAKGADLDVGVLTVLTRSSFRDLERMPRLLATHRVDAWAIAVPRVAGRDAERFDRVHPRLGLALPYALRALEQAQAFGIVTFVLDAPLCLLGPLGARAIVRERLAFAEACGGCALRERCGGVDPVYLRRFGGDELAPRATARAPEPPEGRAARLARVFVGPGSLALERAPADVAPPPERVRRALPLLGRVRPGVAEVSRAAPRRSGEDLRALFPHLFGAEPSGPAAGPAPWRPRDGAPRDVAPRAARGATDDTGRHATGGGPEDAGDET